MTEQLWAPWRLKYIESGGKTAGCIFCDFPQERRDRELYIVHRAEHGYLILNAFPYANGHLMAVPYRHTATLDDLTDAELLDLTLLSRLSVNLLKATFKPEGFNLGMNMGRVAGAGIDDHLHWHIVPRWNGDTNFMPVLADVRVIPESLTVVYDRLREALPALLSS